MNLCSTPRLLVAFCFWTGFLSAGGALASGDDAVFDALVVAQAQTPKADAGAGGKLIITPSEDQGMIKFDQPIHLGNDPIDGHSIKELITGKPLYPPIEGLDKSIWEKTCDNCHQWNKDRLCVQAKTYMGQGNALLTRLQHPLGIPFKYVLMRWATGGCQ
jgi:hypothetical protein